MAASRSSPKGFPTRDFLRGFCCSACASPAEGCRPSLRGFLARDAIGTSCPSEAISSASPGGAAPCEAFGKAGPAEEEDDELAGGCAGGTKTTSESSAELAQRASPERSASTASSKLSPFAFSASADRDLVKPIATSAANASPFCAGAAATEGPELQAGAAPTTAAAAAEAAEAAAREETGPGKMSTAASAASAKAFSALRKASSASTAWIRAATQARRSALVGSMRGRNAETMGQGLICRP
mmetsp:Transcript_96020/g.311510  ORF Transcript_96020/g.311510 Transcript_96020/m.311510 type:complete len:242 (+) Transcript_96020:417-1142(+)